MISTAKNLQLSVKILSEIYSICRKIVRFCLAYL